jgi:MFS family permease
VIRGYLARGRRTDLPRLVLLLQAGNAVSFFGYGLILPFEIIYLHQFRGFATATAGFVLAAILGTATPVTPASGTLLDRFRPKPILIAGNLTSALGYAGFAFVDRPWQAFACAVVGGAGIGAAGTANQTLLITLVTPEQRAASFALGRVASNLGLGIGATVAGFIVASAQHLRSFQTLYLFDAITYAAFALCRRRRSTRSSGRPRSWPASQSCSRSASASTPSSSARSSPTSLPRISSAATCRCTR